MTESARIASLETQVRILKRMLFGVFGLVVAGAVLGATSLQTVPDVLRARSIQLVDENEKPVILLGKSSRGTGMAIVQAGNKGGVAIGINELGESFVTLKSSRDTTCASITSNKDGSGGVSVFNGNRSLAVGLSTDENGGLLIVCSKEGKPIGGINSNTEGEGNLVTFDAKGRLTSKSP